LFFSERSIARYKANHSEDIVLATKFLPYPYKFSYPSSLINALRASLERLQVCSRFYWTSIFEIYSKTNRSIVLIYIKFTVLFISVRLKSLAMLLLKRLNSV